MLVIPAPAKVNLALEVVRRRDDGWHDIESVLVPIDWHDLVGIRLGRGDPAVRVTGSASRGVPGSAEGPPAADNLAVRAAAALLAAAGGATSEASGEPAALGGRRPEVWVDKRVPPAAGLGGGSADAAAMLLGGARLLRAAGVSVEEAQLAGIAETLGSDVPALLGGRAVRVSGRGQRLTTIAVPPLHLVVTFLGAASTGDAYRSVQPAEWTDGSRVDRLVIALAGSSRPPEQSLGSALEGPALRVNPDLAAAAGRLRRDFPGLGWHMTGSGGAFFAVLPDASAARALAARLRGQGVLARACRTRTTMAGAA